jgi:non-homologous end joining protein Ku
MPRSIWTGSISFGLVSVPQEAEGGEVVDLMDALRQSVAQTKRKQKQSRGSRPGERPRAHKTGAKRKAS